MSEEVFISDYFQSYDEQEYSNRDWKVVNRIRDEINSYEWEKDIYDYLYNRRLSSAARDEDYILFNIPKDARVIVSHHANIQNKWYKYYSYGYDENGNNNREKQPKKDYFKRKNGKVVTDKHGNPKEYGRFGQAMLNIGDKAVDKYKKAEKLVKFVIMHPIASLIIVLTPIVLTILIWLILYVGGILGSIGHTPFVLCGDQELDGKSTNVDVNADLDQMATIEYAAQAFIYQTDQLHWKPNAVIGALAYILRESGGMGTFSYEGYYSIEGPSGVTYDKELNNEEWLTWLESSGKQQLHDYYYHNPNGSGHSCFEDSYTRYAAVGMGLLQESNVWNYNKVWIEGDDDHDGYYIEEPYLVTDNATKMIEWCNEQGKAWQDPLTQINWVIERLTPSSAWDGDNANPINDNRTAEEWCRRVCCGIGMPAWRYNTTNPTQNKYINDHVAYLTQARELYNQYSGKSLDIASLGSYLKDQCEGLKSVYSGGNASIADAAVSLASGDGTMGDTRYYWDQDGSSSPNLQHLPNYKKVHEVIFPGDVIFASCDRSSACAVRWAGADDTFPIGDTATQYRYLTTSNKWDYIGIWGSCMLQPGDVIITQGKGHIKIYVGTEASNKRFPGSTAEYYQGSYHDYFPFLGADGPQYDSRTYAVFRCTNPDNSPRYKNALTGEIVEE